MNFLNAALRLSGNTDFSVRIIPTATSLFCTSKLNLGRNNVRAVEEGRAYESLIVSFRSS